MPCATARHPVGMLQAPLQHVGSVREVDHACNLAFEKQNCTPHSPHTMPEGTLRSIGKVEAESRRRFAGHFGSVEYAREELRAPALGLDAGGDPPSPWNGVAASTARIAAMSVSSDTAVFGPRLAPDDPVGDAVRDAAAYAVERGTR